nr:hypothetical protein [uncultured Albidiferax sp.]
MDELPLLRQTKAAYGAEYEKHFFEQYKLYVEMADRVSARRILANSFFVGVHTALITAFTVLLKEKVLQPSLAGLAPFLAVMLLCFIWWRVVYSYRQLNSAKFKVVHALEQMLPVAPYDAEWTAMGRGTNARLYLPLTHVENWVPVCFGLLYLLLAMTLYSRG